jgi:hypothetical protein
MQEQTLLIFLVERVGACIDFAIVFPLAKFSCIVQNALDSLTACSVIQFLRMSVMKLLRWWPVRLRGQA